MDNAPSECRRNLAEVVVPWPELQTLQQNAQTDVDWQLFKNTFVYQRQAARPHTASAVRPISVSVNTMSRPTTAAR